MHQHKHQHRHVLQGNVPRMFEGRGSRIYGFFSRTVFRGIYRRIARDVAALAPPNATLLDIGTGPGMLLAELARLRPDLHLTGIDLSADMVEVAAENLGGKGTVQVGDVARLPFEDRSFDVIVSSFSSHHWDDPEAAAPELARVLRPGGRAHIYDFTWAPFETIGAKENPTRIRLGVPFFPRSIRATLSA